jgi:S-adenosylmethionine hydrolase
VNDSSAGRQIITLLTDFGTADTYAGVMKGVIAGIAPQAKVIDLTHGVSPQGVRAGAFHLLAAYSYFPTGTIHVAVVDPGVGTARDIVAVRAGDYTFIGPDNGLLRWAVDAATGSGPAPAIVAVENTAYRLPHVSRTFHGRDIMAPAAAHLANGVPLESLGPSRPDLVGEPLPQPAMTSRGIEGTVLHVDHFGNCVTNLRAVAPGSRVYVNSREARVVQTYADGAEGELVALVSSAGFLEIAVRGGNAASAIPARAGARVFVATPDAPTTPLLRK